jgi:hypothetical protein
MDDDLEESYDRNIGIPPIYKLKKERNTFTVTATIPFAIWSRPKQS